MSYAFQAGLELSVKSRDGLELLIFLLLPLKSWDHKCVSHQDWLLACILSIEEDALSSLHVGL